METNKHKAKVLSLMLPCKKSQEDDKPTIDIDDVINHIDYDTYVDWDDYTIYRDYAEFVDWDKYIKEKVDEQTIEKISQGLVPYTILEDTYKYDSCKAIQNKLCLLIPKNILKVKDFARKKYSIYCQEKWLSIEDSKEKLLEIINTLQHHIDTLHRIYFVCYEKYKPHEWDKFLRLQEKVYQGKDIHNIIINRIIDIYNN
jgi:hypothetical protein